MATTANDNVEDLATSKAYHLDWIQQTIRRYSFHALAIKMLTLALTIAMLVTMAVVGSTDELMKGTYQWSLTAAVALVFILWLIDTHYHQQQRRYNYLYESVRKTDGPTNLDMSISSTADTVRYYAVLWERPLSWLYVGCLVALTIPAVFR